MCDHDGLKADAVRFLDETVWPLAGNRVQSMYNDAEQPDLLLGNCPHCQSTLALPIMRTERIGVVL